MPGPLTPAELHLLADELELEADRLARESRAKARMARLARDRAIELRRAEMEPAA